MHEDEHWASADAPPSSSRQLDRQSLLARAAALGLTGAGAAAFADVLTPAAFAEEAMHSAGGGGTLRFRLENDISNLDPAFFPTEADEVVTGCIHEGLLTFKPGTFDVVNCLAETFTPSKDGLRFTFKLKEGVQFHGGYGEVTAEDVKYSYERIAGITKPNIHSPYAGDWSTLKEVKVTGNYTGTIILKERFAPLLHSTLPAGSGLVLSKKALLKLGNKGIAVHPIGTGPFVFTKWTPKQKVTITKNPDYAGSNKAYVKGKTYDAIEFLPIDDDSAAETGLRAGDIDFSRISSGSVDRFKKLSNIKMYENASLDYEFLSMNVQDKVLKDVRLRQAIRLAIDVPSIISAAYDDKWEQAYAIIPKSMGLGYWKDAPKYKRDVDAAKKLVAAAGADGITLRLALVNAEADKTAGQVIQSNLKDIGITVDIIVQDSATLFAIPGGGGDGKKRQLIYSGYVSEPDPSWSTVWWICSQMGVWNWDNWCSKPFSALHDRALKETDDAKRQAMYVSMQKLWDKEASMVWIGYPTYFSVGSTKVNPKIRPDGHRHAYAFTAV
jgi:peptide/nickel transport system substrate-binding protein